MINWQQEAERFSETRHGSRTDELREAMMHGANLALTLANSIVAKADARITAQVEANVRPDSGESKVIALNGNGNL